MASSTAPRGLGVLADRCFDLQSADFLCFFIRKRRLAYIVCIGFLQCGIPHRTYRFYCCLAAHQRTRKKDSAEPSFPILWTPPLPPGGYPLRRGILAAAVDRDIVSCIQVLSLLASSECCAAICVRAGIVRVSVDFAGHMSFVFHYWMEKRRC